MSELRHDFRLPHGRLKGALASHVLTWEVKYMRWLWRRSAGTAMRRKLALLVDEMRRCGMLANTDPLLDEDELTERWKEVAR